MYDSVTKFRIKSVDVSYLKDFKERLDLRSNVLGYTENVARRQDVRDDIDYDTIT